MSTTPPRSIVAMLWHITTATIRRCIDYRVVGLGAESAFFALLSLPPIVFALTGAIGFIVGAVDPSTVLQLRDQLLNIAAQFLTQDAIDSIIAPTIDDVLTSGRVDVVSIGSLIALWTGSRAIAVLIDTVAVMYGHQGDRGFVRRRALSMIAFLVLLIVGMVLIPLILTGPTLVRTILPNDLDWLARLYWPTVGVGTVGLVTTIFWLVVPRRERWLNHLPGAIWTLAMWLVGSQIVRLALSVSADSPTIYGPLATPIALLLWLYVMSLAMLIGAAVNKAVSEVRPGPSDSTGPVKAAHQA